MHREEIVYQCGETALHGYLCYNRDIKGKRPAILVAHAWRGRDRFAIQQAEALARMGYIAFAADVYGKKEPAKNDEEAANLMMPLFVDRALLQKRIRAAFDTVSCLPQVDSTCIGAIGYCFGGLTVIELLRSGAPVNGVVSFHGVLGDQMAGRKAHTVALSPNIKGSILLLHGHNDPLVSSEDIARLQTELTTVGIDWQMTIYGHASHAFTNPEAANKEMGLLYNEAAARRSWIAMTNFFDDILKFQKCS